MQSLTDAHPRIITFLLLKLSEQHALSYLPRIFEKLVFLSLMYLYHIPHLHFCANSEANDERTNHIFAWSFVALFASLFVVLALEAVFQTRVKGDEWWFTLCVRTCKCLYARENSSFAQRQEAYKCLCKWRDEARARICKCGFRLHSN